MLLWGSNINTTLLCAPLYLWVPAVQGEKDIFPNSLIASVKLNKLILFIAMLRSEAILQARRQQWVHPRMQRADPVDMPPPKVHALKKAKEHFYTKNGVKKLKIEGVFVRAKLLFLAATVLIHRSGHLGEPKRIHSTQIIRGGGGYRRHRGLEVQQRKAT